MCSQHETTRGNSAALPTYSGLVQGGKIVFEHPLNLPEGSRVAVQVAPATVAVNLRGHAVIAGFGPAGRWVADVLERFSVPYRVIERNPRTVESQEALGRQVIFGDAAEAATLQAAEIQAAGLLVTTIPDEKATVAAVRCAKDLNPEIVIMAKTEFTSTALMARKAGADVVVPAEIAVAREFHQVMLLYLTGNLPVPCLKG